MNISEDKMVDFMLQQTQSTGSILTKLEDMDKTLDEVKKEVRHTNGRVTKLETMHIRGADTVTVKTNKKVEIKKFPINKESMLWIIATFGGIAAYVIEKLS